MHLIVTSQRGKQPKKENSPIMNALIGNNVSNILKSSTVIQTEEFSDVLFPGIMVTNAYMVQMLQLHGFPFHFMFQIRTIF